MKRRDFLPWWCAGMIIAVAAAIAEGGYTIVELENPQYDDHGCSPFAINNLGQVVGDTLMISTYDAFLYLPQPAYGRPAGVHLLSGCGGVDQCGRDINDAGRIVCRNSYGGVCISDDGGASWQELEQYDSSVYAVNNPGECVGSYGEQHPNAVLWQAGQRIVLGKLPGASWGRGRGINDPAQVVGDCYISSGYHAFLVTPVDSNGDGQPDLWNVDNNGDGVNDLMVELPSLSGAESRADDINNAGQIVGWAETLAGEQHACLWGTGGAANDLGTLSGTVSEARAINSLGQVVGYSELATGENHAFLWQGGVMQDLNDLIPAGSGWTLHRAADINDHGWIVGWGTNPAGEGRGFVLVPEPATLALLAVGGLGLLARRSRKQSA